VESPGLLAEATIYGGEYPALYSIINRVTQEISFGKLLKDSKMLKLIPVKFAIISTLK